MPIFPDEPIGDVRRRLLGGMVSYMQGDEDDLDSGSDCGYTVMSKELPPNHKVYFAFNSEFKYYICWTEWVEDWREFLRREFQRAVQFPVLVPGTQKLCSLDRPKITP